MSKLERLLNKNQNKHPVIRTKTGNNDKLKRLIQNSSYKTQFDQCVNLIKQGKNYFEQNKEEECKDCYYKAKEILEPLHNNYQKKDLYLKYGKLLSDMAYIDEAIVIYDAGISKFSNNEILKEAKEELLAKLNSEAI